MDHFGTARARLRGNVFIRLVKRATDSATHIIYDGRELAMLVNDPRILSLQILDRILDGREELVILDILISLSLSLHDVPFDNVDKLELASCQWRRWLHDPFALFAAQFLFTGDGVFAAADKVLTALGATNLEHSIASTADGADRCVEGRAESLRAALVTSWTVGHIESGNAELV